MKAFALTNFLRKVTSSSLESESEPEPDSDSSPGFRFSGITFPGPFSTVGGRGCCLVTFVSSKCTLVGAFFGIVPVSGATVSSSLSPSGLSKLGSPSGSTSDSGSGSTPAPSPSSVPAVSTLA